MTLKKLFQVKSKPRQFQFYGLDSHLCSMMRACERFSFSSSSFSSPSCVCFDCLFSYELSPFFIEKFVHSFMFCSQAQKDCGLSSRRFVCAGFCSFCFFLLFKKRKRTNNTLKSLFHFSLWQLWSLRSRTNPSDRSE